MADTVDSLVLLNGRRRYRIRLTCSCDGTGESAVVKISKAALTNLNGVAPQKISIEKIEYNVQGFSSVRLYWLHTVPDELAFLPAGASWITYDPPITDPASAGLTGDVILYTISPIAGATYDIVIHAIIGN